jgi:hypothetical protein
VSPSEPIRLRAPARDPLADLFGADYLLLFACPTTPRWRFHPLHLDTELHFQIPPLPLERSFMLSQKRTPATTPEACVIRPPTPSPDLAA